MLKQIRVGHLTSVHPPLDSRILYKECVTLARDGYEVVLIAATERDEVIDGVRIRGVPEPKSRFDRMTRTIWNVLRTALDERIDVCHFHDPELIPVGVLLKLSGKRVVYDVHENLPLDILTKKQIAPLLKNVMALIAKMTEQLAATLFDGIVAATPAIAKRFPSTRTVTVQNYPVLDRLLLEESRPYAKRNASIAYIGAMTTLRGICEMIEAMTFLSPSLNAKLVLAGSCDTDLELHIRKLEGWRYVEFVGWLSQEEIAPLLCNTKVGLVLLHPIRGYMESYPTKMFEYMAAGVPVVASNFPLWRDIIEQAGCGILVDPLDSKSIAAAIQWLLDHPADAEQMGNNGRVAVHRRYNWAVEAERLKGFYRIMSGKCSATMVRSVR